MLCKYDRFGFNREGYSKNGVTRLGETTSQYDPSMYDKQNFTRLGLDPRGLDFSGRDIFGYDSRGFDSEGCNGHYNDGYFYVKQKYELDLELSTISQEDLDKISRLCTAMSSPHSFIYMSSWVIVDPTHNLRGNLPGPPTSQQIPETRIWVPDGPDSRFCIELNIYSSCSLGEKPRQSSCVRDLCDGTECPSYRSEATCRTIGCDNSCRIEWYHNGMVVTSSCIGCKDVSTNKYYGEGDRWLTADGCGTCECVAGASRCSGCPHVSCSHPEQQGCCPRCQGCEYEGHRYLNQEVFLSQVSPCDQCQCRDGTVSCVTRTCPSLLGCREVVKLNGSCCAICLSCGERRNGATWSEDECTTCECQDGRTKCNVIDCGSSRCTHPVKLRGVCCPQCQACSYMGSYYNDGQTFSPDGCQSCTCQRGNVVCTPPTCPPITCQYTYTPAGACCPVCQDGCQYSGKHYDDGAVFSPTFNRCMNCTCTDHKVRCSNVRCPDISRHNCSRPIALPGDCCPSFCPDCVYEGVEYKHSDSWRPSNRPCDVCICYNGVVSCRTRTRCQNTCSYGVYSDNECCSPCTDCDLDGEVHKDGSTFARVTNQGCTECSCQGGNIQCSSATQTCPQADCVNPIQIPNTCCPRCPGCSGGRQHGDRWRNQTNPCEICECRDEIVQCYPQPCPALAGTCVTRHLNPGACCPICMDCMASGQLYVNGTSFNNPDDNCSTCTCVNSAVSCTRDACPPVDCLQPVVLPGNCCPTCSNCELDDGQVYRHGENLTREDKPCETCVCVSGTVKCTPNPCPVLDCETPVVLPGNCCPSCGECVTSNGTVYDNGERFQSPADTCSDCICINGQIACDPRPCLPALCSKPVVLPGNCCPTCQSCELEDGEVYGNGEQLPSEYQACSTCLCDKINLKVFCNLYNFLCNALCKYVNPASVPKRDSEVHPNPCPVLDCDTPVVLPENCCPSCGECVTSNGTVYDNGERFQSPADTCSDCICINEEVRCEKKACPAISCDDPIVLPGKCCPTCINRYCEYNNVTIANGDSIDDGCRECKCLSGRVTCVTKLCPIALCPSPVMGECCLECTDCLQNGVRIASGSTVYENETCSTCTCLSGLVSCFRKACPFVTCLNPPQLIAVSRALMGVNWGPIYAEGEAIRSADDPCVVCHCNAGNVEYPTFHPRQVRDRKCATRLYIAQPFLPEPNDPSGILKDGEEYFDYETCSNCSCDAGSLTCIATSQCPSVSCDHPRLDGCCPNCNTGCSLGNWTLELDEPVPHPDDPSAPVVLVIRKDSCGCDICMETPVCTSPLNSSVVFQPGDTWTNEANCAARVRTER
ncbi:hypothetical protein EB796_024947 [Bugula neritina]|uniref:VWFC domain-containing protein n=1 Tax=Bugula neritina TaxID=10212 RepID=A0A7J7ISE3_BUGNE|nr:hypothetical protein EB796_024947 [Bugula neritina]